MLTLKDFAQGVKDSPETTARLLKAGEKFRKMSPEHRRAVKREQRISWVMGQKSKENTMTRQEVEELLYELYG